MPVLPAGYYDRGDGTAGRAPERLVPRFPPDYVPPVVDRPSTADRQPVVDQPSTIEFTVPGKPQAWQRVKRGRGGKSYVPKETAAAETAIGWEARAAMGALSPFAGPVKVVFTAYLPRPKGVAPGSVHPIRQGDGDGDNFQKALWDGLNGVAFADDRQVVEWGGRKVYSAEPRLHVLVEAL